MRSGPTRTSRSSTSASRTWASGSPTATSSTTSAGNAGCPERPSTMAVDRRRGYYDEPRETMSPSARRQYQATWLGELIAVAWERAPGMRRRLTAAGLGVGDLGDPDGLGKLPVMKEDQVPDLQQARPQFRGV